MYITYACIALWHSLQFDLRSSNSGTARTRMVVEDKQHADGRLWSRRFVVRSDSKPVRGTWYRPTRLELISERSRSMARKASRRPREVRPGTDPDVVIPFGERHLEFVYNRPLSVY